MKKVKPLDYSKVENWLINVNADTSKPYDLIFFCGTSILEATEGHGVGLNPEMMRKLGFMNYTTCGSQLSEQARVFVPIQRQIALKYALKNFSSYTGLFKDIATKEPYVDLAAALDYYFEHYNKDGKRPFVLAGHSQGASALQIALYKYFLSTSKRKYLKNMIAAYSLGYAVSKKFWKPLFKKYKCLHFAKGKDDYNCIISWNTEGPGKKGYSFLLSNTNDSYVINPLNWKTDETYASAKQNLGVLIMNTNEDRSKISCKISTNPKDLMDAQIDLKRGSLICTTNKNFVNIPKAGGRIWGGKSLHIFDGRGYYNNMKENLKVRVAKFLKDHNK